MPNVRTSLRAVIFDLDGTLIHQELDFEAMRSEIGLPPRTPLLEALDAMSPTERDRAVGILERHESQGALSAAALPGVAAFLSRLDAAGLKRGILTRNSRRSAMAALQQAGLNGFDPILARGDAAYKPDPAGIHLACQLWDLRPSEVLMVGDYLFDVRAGRAAGAHTALVTHGRDWPFAHEADVTIVGFDPLPEILLEWLGL